MHNFLGIFGFWYSCSSLFDFFWPSSCSGIKPLPVPYYTLLKLNFLRKCADYIFVFNKGILDMTKVIFCSVTPTQIHIRFYCILENNLYWIHWCTAIKSRINFLPLSIQWNIFVRPIFGITPFDMSTSLKT